MEILERIETQIAASKLPLFAVTVAAVPCPDTPVILTLHWHGFVRERLADLEEAEVVTYIPIPSSA
ncbi:MAG: diguanylate cyclase, partial [Betaproteobacteria bacterium]|nr:diguanylate cyclase [Betaproteobacteria bacterium]